MKAVLPAGLLVLGAACAIGQPPPPPAAIAGIASQAAAAREANRSDEALRLYRQAVQAAPKWEEGWWQIGTIQYGLDQYPQCRDAFRKFVALNAKLSAGFAFLGLCEFQTKELAAALDHLEKAAALGLPNGEQLSDVAIYHLALLHTKAGNFERALQFAGMLAREGVPDPNVVAVTGIAALRRPIFPHELPESDRDVAFKLGSALMGVGPSPAAVTTARFEELVHAYPKTPNVHYSYATVLLASDPDKGIDQLKQELAIQPDHLPALISLAFEYLKRDKADVARPYAEQAAKVAPRSFAARACLGRVLLGLNPPDVPGAIRELEASAKLAPDSPQVHYSLAAAYMKVGRKQDAARERAEYARLKKLTDAKDIQ